MIPMQFTTSQQASPRYNAMYGGGRPVVWHPSFLRVPSTTMATLHSSHGPVRVVYTTANGPTAANATSGLPVQVPRATAIRALSSPPHPITPAGIRAPVPAAPRLPQAPASLYTYAASTATPQKSDEIGRKKSADELAAAAVLLNLTTKDENSSPTVEQQQRGTIKKSSSKSQGSTTKQSLVKKRKATSSTKLNKSSKIALSADGMPHVSANLVTTAENGVKSKRAVSFEDSSVENAGSRTHSPSLMNNDDPIKWYDGSISLSLPEDDDVLSPLHCFMRRYCVEAFSASPVDVATPRYGKSHGFKVEVGQVGIRCLYCKKITIGKRPERAVCYPSSLKNIYHSIETWQRRHSLVCTHITPWVRKSIMELMKSSKTRAGGRRQYWEDSARRLGMADTPRGVRFVRPPGDLGAEKPEPTSPETKREGAEPVVRNEDKDLVTDYLFLLMEQMQTCKFTEEDRTGGRSKIKDNHVGFPGMECRHCQGRAGFGRYFPSSVSALSLANSDRNVFNHLQKCRRCPNQTKTELIRLSKEQSQSKNRRGLRKLFFSRIWDRMHGESSTEAGEGTASSPVASDY